MRKTKSKSMDKTIIATKTQQKLLFVLADVLFLNVDIYLVEFGSLAKRSTVVFVVN